MRVLHLLGAGKGPAYDGSADDAAAVCGRVLAQELDDHSLLALGPAAFIRRVVSLGAEPRYTHSPPAGRASLSWRMIRRAWRRSRSEVVCCWDRGSASAAVLALGRDAPLMLLTARKQIITGRYRPRRWASIGFDQQEVPALGTSHWAPLTDRRALRAELGIRADEFAVLLLGASREASAIRFAFTLGLARRAGDPVVGIAPAWADQLPRAEYFERRLSTGVRVAISELPRRDLLPAADLAVWVGGGRSATWLPQGLPSRLGVAECFRAGVPVIAPRGLGIDDLYPPEAADACLAEVGMPPEISRRLIPLVESRERVKAIAAACRQKWADKDGVPELAGELHRACHKVANTGGWGEVLTRQISGAPTGA